MAMQKPLQRSLNTLFILVLITFICACGGGKKNKGSTPSSTAVFSSAATSNAVTSSTAATSSAASSITPDTTPDAFTFTPATDVLPNTVNTSAVVTVAGINVAVPISITGGTYAIGAGAFTNMAGTISVGQTVMVKTTAAATSLTAVDVVLTIGGVSAIYKVTTLGDTLAPSAKILFPPPVSQTERNTILVRGSAADAFPIKSVKVNGVLATTTDNFANWQALVPLTDTALPVTETTENTVTVVTEDAVGNIATDAATVAIRQAPIGSAFPDDDNPIYESGGLALDRLDGRNRLLATGNVSGNIYSVDLTTGKRTLFAEPPSDASGIAINAADRRVYVTLNNSDIADFDLADATQFRVHSGGMVSRGSLFLDTTGTTNKWVRVGRIPAAGRESSVTVETVDELFASYSILSDSARSIPDANNPIIASSDAALDKTHKRYLIPGGSKQTIFAVDATTGARSVFSSDSVGAGEPIGEAGFLLGITVDEVNQRALVTDNSTGKIFAVNLETGNRVLISSVTYANQPALIEYITIPDQNAYALVYLTARFAGFIAVDLITGQQVIFSGVDNRG
jgi:hypothetical protein